MDIYRRFQRYLLREHPRLILSVAEGEAWQQFRKDLNKIRNRTGQETTLNRVFEAMSFSDDIRDVRKLSKADTYANPFLMASVLAKYSADEDTIIAAILYPSLRSDPGSDYNATKDLVAIEATFGDHVARLVRNTLQIHDINYLARTAQNELTLRKSKKLLQNDAEHLAAFPLMVEDKIEDAGSALIRLCQALIDLKNMASRYANGEPVDEVSRAARLHRIQTIYMPLADSLNFRELKADLADQWLLLHNPAEYKRLETLIAQATEAITQKTNVNTPQGRQAIVFRKIHQELMDQLPKEIRDDVKIEFRIKRIYSLYLKFLSDEDAGRVTDLSDIVGFRLIFNASQDRYEYPAYVEWAKADEYQLMVKAHSALVASPLFTPVPGRFKDIVKDPTSGGRWVDNGYRAIHNSLRYKAASSANENVPMGEDASQERSVIELILVGRAMYENNTWGTAAHDLYKKKFLVAADKTTAQMVSVYDGNNNIHRLPYGSTVADLAVAINPELTFRIGKITIKPSSTFEETPQAEFTTRLITGYKVSFQYNKKHEQDRERRFDIVNACTSFEARQSLIARHEDLIRVQTPDTKETAVVPVVRPVSAVKTAELGKR